MLTSPNVHLLHADRVCRAQLNPTRMGVPKRCASLNQQVDAFVKEHGGDRPIYRCAGACMI